MRGPGRTSRNRENEEHNLPAHQVTEEVCQGLSARPADDIDDADQDSFRVEYRMNGMP